MAREFTSQDYRFDFLATKAALVANLQKARALRAAKRAAA
jgi:hypothetical protein